MAGLSSSSISGRLTLLAPERWPRSPGGMLAVASGAAVCASALMDPATAGAGPVVCPFRLATGLPCPGGGLTRAWVFLAHGRVGDAVLANPFVLLTMPAAVWLVLATFAALVRRTPPPDLAKITRSTATRVVVAAWLTFALVRLIAVLTSHASA